MAANEPGPALADGSASRRDPWDIPEVRAGMERLLARRAELLAGGAKPIGWKLAFGTEVMTTKLGTTGPLVGFLTDATLLAPDAEVSIEGWTAPKLEPEIAIHLGPGGEGVAGVSAAIELADADRPPTEIEEVLTGDIFHRAVVLDREAEPVPLAELSAASATDPEPGANAAGENPLGDGAGRISARIERDGEEFARSEDAEAELGRIEDLATWTVTYLRHFGVETAEGEVVISGSVVPILDIAPGQRLTNDLTGIGALSVYILT